MPITVTNPPQLKLYKASQLEKGKLYKIRKKDDTEDDTFYLTVYTKSVTGHIVWFEEGRVGVTKPESVIDDLVLAPEGTEVLLKV